MVDLLLATITVWLAPLNRSAAPPLDNKQDSELESKELLAANQVWKQLANSKRGAKHVLLQPGDTGPPAVLIVSSYRPLAGSSPDNPVSRKIC